MKLQIADHFIEVEPQAGTNGETLVFEGRYQELRADTVTAMHLKRTLPLKRGTGAERASPREARVRQQSAERDRGHSSGRVYALDQSPARGRVR